MSSPHLGIFALAFLTLILTVPSAFAQVSEDNPALDNSNAAFVLMEKITDAEEEAETLDALITSNSLNMGKGLAEYTEVLYQAKELVADGQYEAVAQLLDSSEDTIDDIYTQLYAQVDSRQNERFTEFVDKATTSIDFILTNAATLGISQTVYDELEITLAILESGNYEEILAVTSEDSNIGLTASMFPQDHPGFGNASPNNNGQGKGLGLGDADNLPPGLQKLPPGIQKRYDISTDSNLSTVSSDGTEGTNSDGVTNDEDFDFFSTLPGWDMASPDNNGQGQGVGLGVGPEAPGIMKKDMDWLYDLGFISDDSWEDPFEDDDFSKGQGKGKGRDCAHGKCAGGQGQGQGSGSGSGQGQGQGQGQGGEQGQGQGGGQGQGQGGGQGQGQGGSGGSGGGGPP